MPKILTRLRIDEISSVDRGANNGLSKITLMKRDDSTSQPSTFCDIFRGAMQSTLKLTPGRISILKTTTMTTTRSSMTTRPRYLKVLNVSLPLLLRHIRK
jgi:hypothetical protein